MLDQFPSPPSVWLRRAVAPRIIDVLEDGFILDHSPPQDSNEISASGRVVDRKDWRKAGRYGAPATVIAVGSLIEYNTDAIGVLGPTGWTHFGSFRYKEDGPRTLDAKLISFFRRRQSSLPPITRSGLPWALVLIEDPVARANAIRAFLAGPG